MGWVMFFATITVGSWVVLWAFCRAAASGDEVTAPVYDHFAEWERELRDVVP